jgi:hypothetical protein
LVKIHRNCPGRNGRLKFFEKNSQEPSDLAEKKIRYDELSSSVSSKEIRAIGSKSARAVGSLAKSHFGVS